MAPEYKGEKNYQSDFSVTDKNIITANGIASIEFAGEIFKKTKLHSEKDIEKWFQLLKNGIRCKADKNKSKIVQFYNPIDN